MDIEKIDLLFGYIVAVAGQEDFPNKELRPIHLLKYLYLADFAYSQKSKGVTFTGLPWKFHHFGPWSVDAFQRIEPAMLQIGAQQRFFESRYTEDEAYTWFLDDEIKMEEIAAKLPLSIILPIKSSIRKFGTDTYALLHYVYQTPPMVNSSPGDLIFHPTKDCQNSIFETREPISKKQKKRQRDILLALKERVKEKLSTQRIRQHHELVEPTPAILDEVYFEGISTLEALAGPPIPQTTYKVKFSESIWQSNTRKNPDVA